MCYQGVALTNRGLDSVFWGAPEASPLENAFSGSPNRATRKYLGSSSKKRREAETCHTFRGQEVPGAETLIIGERPEVPKPETFMKFVRPGVPTAEHSTSPRRRGCQKIKHSACPRPRRCPKPRPSPFPSYHPARACTPSLDTGARIFWS